MLSYVLPVMLAAHAGLASTLKPTHAQEYDYIIVGGGTAGLALATRLSQGLPDASILVIEAGPSALDDDGINVPGLKGSTLGGKYDWNFTTVPQAHLNNRTIATPRGRVLGGSSALNFLTWDRASAAEYDSWEVVGNPGWNWHNMSAAMLKAETYIHGPPGSGMTGPIQAVINRVEPLHQKTFVPAVSQHFPIPFNPNSLQGNPIGVMAQPENIAPASYNRSYSANAYLPVAGANLAVLTDAPVAKVIFHPNPNHNSTHSLHTASGIALHNGSTLHARKSVILCAGALATPPLLERSGIGDGAVLRAARIAPLLVDLPGVGANYQDHLRVQVSYQLRDGFVSGDWLNVNATFAAEEWAKRGRGEQSFYDDTGGGYVFAGWERVVEGGEEGVLVRLAEAAQKGDVGSRVKVGMLRDAAVPQVEVIFSDGYTGVKGYPPKGSPLYGKGFFALIGGLMHPFGRGSVHVDPGNPLGKPVIDPGFLDNEYDMAGLVEILKFCRRIARTEPVRSVWVAEYEPGEELVQTDEDWREYVRNTTLTVFHPIGTAAMLPRGDGGAVDSSLVVYGTKNLRVVDASIIPVQISAHPQTAVYGIAERAAEMIIAEHR